MSQVGKYLYMLVEGKKKVKKYKTNWKRVFSKVGYHNTYILHKITNCYQLGHDEY